MVERWTLSHGVVGRRVLFLFLMDNRYSVKGRRDVFVFWLNLFRRKDVTSSEHEFCFSSISFLLAACLQWIFRIKENTLFFWVQSSGFFTKVFWTLRTFCWLLRSKCMFFAV